MVSNLNPELRMAKHRDFLKANWRSIATLAYENYLAKIESGVRCVSDQEALLLSQALGVLRPVSQGKKN